MWIMFSQLDNIDSFGKSSNYLLIVSLHTCLINKGRSERTILVGPAKLYHVVGQDFGDAANFCRDNKQPRRGGFNDTDPKGFRQRRIQVYLTTSQDLS